MLLAGMLALGFSVPWAFASAWILQVTQQFAGHNPPDTLLFLADGTALLVHADGPYEPPQYHDLEGQSVLRPPEEVRAKQLILTPLANSPDDLSARGSVTWEQRVRTYADGTMPPAFWYMIADKDSRSLVYFVGYDRKTNACVGYIGKAGFRPGPVSLDEYIPLLGPLGFVAENAESAGGVYPAPIEETFYDGTAVYTQWVGTLASSKAYLIDRDEQLCLVDFQARSIAPVLRAPGLCALALTNERPDAAGVRMPRLLARTRDAVLFLDRQGKELRRHSIPVALRDQYLHFAETDNKEAIMYATNPRQLPSQVDHQIYWVGQDANARHASVTLPTIQDDWRLARLAWAAAPTPAGMAFLVATDAWSTKLERGLAKTYPEALARSLSAYWFSLLNASCVSAAFAVLCYRRQVRYGAKGAERILWPLFILVFGLPGWIGYRLGRSWPLLETCPECHTPVARDQDDCPSCAAGFPKPAFLGTEVFA